jgi:CHAD domain-containing protein
MSFTFRLDEPIDQGMRRLALLQIDDAVEALAVDGNPSGCRPPAEPGELDERIHDARQALKRLRSLLRLMRGELGEIVFERENAAVRDVARELARAREAAALIESFDEIFSHAEPMARERFSAIRGLLTARCHGLKAEQIGTGAIERAVDDLHKVRERVFDWPLVRDDFRALAPGLRRTYRAGVRMLKRAERETSRQSMHEWRKREKHHLHHVRLLASIFPEELEARGDALHALSDALGELHDLALLREELPRLSEPDPADLAALSVFMDFLEQRLIQRAFALGRRLYAE